MADAIGNEIRDVKGCQRCGRDHDGMIFTPLVNAVDSWRRWARCPVTNQPVLLAVVHDDAGEYAAAVDPTDGGNEIIRSMSDYFEGRME